MKRLLLGVALSIAATGAIAQNAKQGWGVQFREDTFDGVTFPIAMVTEETDSFSKASLFLACGSDGLVSFFQTGGLSFDNSVKATFRDGSATREFVFAAGDVPNLGRRLTMNASDTADLIAIFEAAGGASVAFRLDNRQGTLPSVATSAVTTIMEQHCPSNN
jgi:thioredoxin reductase